MWEQTTQLCYSVVWVPHGFYSHVMSWGVDVERPKRGKLLFGLWVRTQAPSISAGLCLFKCETLFRYYSSDPVFTTQLLHDSSQCYGSGGKKYFSPFAVNVTAEQWGGLMSPQNPHPLSKAIMPLLSRNTLVLGVLHGTDTVRDLLSTKAGLSQKEVMLFIRLWKNKGKLFCVYTASADLRAELLWDGNTKKELLGTWWKMHRSTISLNNVYMSLHRANMVFLPSCFCRDKHL